MPGNFGVSCGSYAPLVLVDMINMLNYDIFQLSDELMDIKNIPEVSVLKNLPSYSAEENMSPRISSDDQSNSQKHLKQIEALLYENKTLKTNMYWLATELKTVKKKEGLTSPRIRLDSGGLEGEIFLSESFAFM